MQDTYAITIAGLRRELPLCRVDDKLRIAAFILFGDVEITIAAAAALLEKCPAFDAIVTPEAKGIPLAYEMARQSGKPYVIARKGLKVYMREPVHTTVRSITTAREQTLYLDGVEGERLRGKRVLVVDDVISTGESLEAVAGLLAPFDVEIAAKAAVLAEGDAAARTDLLYLEPLPLFFDK